MLKKSNEIIKEVKKVVIGKDEIITKMLMVILAKGHILIEDIPGVGKTTLALAFSKAMSLEYKRIQFTPDIMPSDITGFSIYNKQSGTFDYKPGAAMCNLFLADEINRTSSKTQSALLEVMEEGSVTVDGITHAVPHPFLVIATQNPVGSAGTQMLPESQLDRFMVRLTMGYPDLESEINILKGRQTTDPIDQVQKIVSAADILSMQEAVSGIFISDSVYSYIAQLTSATRNLSYLQLGVSPRGTLAVCKVAKACAFLYGRDYVIPDDIPLIFADVCAHRVVLSPQAKVAAMSAETILNNLLKQVKPPKIG